MAKFSFRLQNILNIKEKMESQAKTSYAMARAKLNSEEEKLDGLFQKKKELEDGLREISVGTINIKDMVFYQNSIEYTKNLIKRQIAEVAAAGKNLDVAQRKLEDAMKERKTYETLREHSFEDFINEINAQEKKEIDELVSFRFDGGGKA